MSGAVFTLGNSVSGSLSLGSALSKFGRVAGQAGFTIEQDEETLNNTVTSRYAGLAAVTVSGVTSVLNPSLVLIPSAYNTSGSTGILYSLHSKPNGVADFVVTRATEGTRFNSVGRISTVGSGDARLDYLTSGGTVGTPALLVEPSAANLAYNSTDTRTSWTLGANLSSGYVDVIGVSGNTLSVITSGSNIGSTPGRLTRTSNETLVSGTTYTFSFLMKKTGTHTIGGYYIATLGTPDIGGGFDVSGSFSSGSFYNAGVTNRIRKVEQWGTDVYRCSETFTATASGAILGVFFAPLAAVNSFNNPAVGAGIAFAAPQLEVGSVPTSFIPTLGSQVTRNADVISVSTVSGCIGQSEGTIYTELDFSRAIASIAIIVGNSSNENFRIRKAANFGVLVQAVNTSGATTLFTSSAASAGIYKVAFGYKNGDYAMSVNGATVLTSNNSTNFPVNGLSIISLGETIGGVPYFNDRIRSVALYTTRLTNAELAALTL